MQSGVPTMDLRIVLSPLSRLRANPKSLILSLFQWIRMLAGFRSRCMVSLLFMYSNPLMISLRKPKASFYVSFFFLFKQVRRSPPSQNQVTMYMLLLVWQTSSSLTMFQCSSFFMIYIQEWMFLRLYWLANMRFQMTLTATPESLVVSLPRKTEAYEPFPRRWFMEQMYFSIFFSPSDSCLPLSQLVMVVK